MTVDVSPKGRNRRARVRSIDRFRLTRFRLTRFRLTRFSLNPGLDWRTARTSLFACCCATTLATAALPAKARAQQPTSQSPAAPAPPEALPQQPFASEVVPVGSDVEASTSGWRSLLATLNKDEEGPTLRAGSVVSGGGFALGGHWRETLATRARLDTEYLVSIKGYQRALVDLSSQPIADGRITFGAGIEYDSLPMEDFFGLGPSSDLASHTSYERQGIDTRAWMRIRVRPWLELKPTVGHIDTRLLSGSQAGIPSIEALSWASPVEGVGRQSRFLHGGLTLTLDRRDTLKYTRSGGFLRASIERYDGLLARDKGFVKTEIDARGYLPIHGLSSRDVLAVRGVALLTDGTRHESAPFYFLPRLGGGMLRGYETSRFVDTQALFASVEYRWQAARRLQIVTFVDSGAVAPAMRAFSTSTLQTSVGAGIRYRGFRVDYARGAEGGRLHVGVGASF